MAKTVKEERLAIVLELTRKDGTEPVEVSGRADYAVTSDDLVENRSMELNLTASQKNTLKSFANKVLQAIKQKEIQ